MLFLFYQFNRITRIITATPMYVRVLVGVSGLIGLTVFSALLTIALNKRSQSLLYQKLHTEDVDVEFIKAEKERARDTTPFSTVDAAEEGYGSVREQR
jgi:hypothetical protein